MKSIYQFLLVVIIVCSYLPINAQAIWNITDPSGNDIIVEPDLAFITIQDDYIILYTIDKTTNLKNLLITRGDSSFWLLPIGFEKSLRYTDFIHRKKDELIFGIDGTWYITKGTPATTQIFYDNHSLANIYEYQKISEFSSYVGNVYNLAIEAIEKTTGDTVTLYHTTSMGSTTLLDYKVRILEGNLSSFGPWEGIFFLGHVYDETNQTWGKPGIYRELVTDLHLLLKLENRDSFRVNTIYLGNSFIADRLEDGTTDVYKYEENLDSLVNVTQSEFPGYEVLDIFNVKWPYWGTEFPNNPPYSYQNLIWKGRDQGGNIKYFLRDVLGYQWEIIDVRNDPEVDFIFSHVPDDSIYYYSYNETQSGLIRANFLNGGNVKEFSSIPFDSDYKLRGYQGKMYFGRYDAALGSIVAVTKDFINDNKYEYLESSTGARIENPIDFTFLEDKVIVHSRTDEGIKLVVFDHDAIVSVSRIEEEFKGVVVSPNPSSGQVKLQIMNPAKLNSNLIFNISDFQGKVLLNGKFSEDLVNLDLSQFSSGLYFISIWNSNSLIYNQPFVLAE